MSGKLGCLPVFVTAFIFAAALVFAPAALASEIDANAHSDMFFPKAADFTRMVRVGINIGNTLDAHGEGASGLETETMWGNPKIGYALFQALKDKGLDIVRIPVTWEPHMDEDYNIDEAWLDRVENVVKYAQRAGLYVILNTQHEETYLLPAVAANDYAAASAELKAIWRQLAERFKDNDPTLIFDVLNEPRAFGTAREWSGGTSETHIMVNKLNADALETIRASGGNNAKRLVMLPSVAASVWYSSDLNVPKDDYVLVSIHAYEPYSFALEMPGVSTFKTNDDTISNVFKQINTNFLSKKIPVIMDETGAMNKSNLEERVKWAKSFGKAAAAAGVPVLLWDNGVTDMSQGESFGLIDRESNQWIFPEVVEAFIAEYPKEPVKAREAFVIKGDILVNIVTAALILTAAGYFVGAIIVRQRVR